jgi:1-acyl-sn-glycerol-3-phosphate acyltransferase
MIFRVCALVIHCLYGLFLCLFLGRLSAERQERIVKQWHQQVLNIFKVTVDIQGLASIQEGLASPSLIAANHISWLDVHVIAAQFPVTFVAKSDVSSWPVFGRFASTVNTIFLNLNRASDIKRVLREVQDRFKQGQRVCIFPEGTSSDGKEILPFKSNLFQAAIEGEVPVIPLLLQYRLHDQFTQAPAYYGDMTLIESFKNLFLTPNIVAKLSFLPSIHSSVSRQSLSDELRLKLISSLKS